MKRICAALVGALGLICGGCAEPPPAAEVLRPVRSIELQAGGGSRTRTFSGTARAGQETQLSFRVPGTIEHLNVRVGETVRAGQVLGRLEQNDYEIAVRQAEANLAQAEASLRNSESALDRIRGLYENENASQNDLDGALAQAQSSRALVQSRRESLAQSRRQLDYAVLRAPVEGAIANVTAEVGENVRQGQTVVLMSSGSRQEVEVGMPEQLIAQVHEGAQVQVAFDALPDTKFDAVVTEVGVASTGTATMFPVTVWLDRISGDVRSGMAATVSFSFEADFDGQRIYVPSQAVGEDRKGRFVFVLDATDEPGVGRVVRTPVVVGELTAAGLELREGPAVGRRIVTAGVRRLRDGQQVRLSDPGAPR